MARYTNEEMSRILSAHEGGQLVRNGMTVCDRRECSYCVFSAAYGARGCVNQVASLDDLDTIQALAWNREGASWFDSNYEPDMPTEALLAKLDEVAK